MSFPSSQIGLPSSLKYELPPSLSDSARSYSVNVSPDSTTSVVAPSPSATAFVANNTGAMGQFNPQMISFTLPSGMSPSVFLDPTHTNLSFTLTYNVTTASSVTAGFLNLIGSAQSFFDQLIVYSNNTPVETINQYGLLANYLLANSVNLSERSGGFSTCLGCDTNNMTGIELAHAAVASYRYNFCIPLISILGVNTEKMIPIGSLNNVQLQMMTCNTYPLASFCTGAATQPVFSNFTLSEFQLNLKYIDVGDLASNLLQQTLQDGKWMIKSSTYTHSAVSLPSGSNGAQQLLLQIRNSSVKSVYNTFGIAQGAVCPNGMYDSICPSLNSRQLQVGGQYFPNKPINDIQRPAEGYYYLVQSMGGSLVKALGTCVDRYNYSVCVPSVVAGSDTTIVVSANAVRPNPSGNDEADVNVVKYPNSHYHGYDIEKVSGILFSGINTRAAPPFLNLNLAQATTSTVALNAWGYSDVVLMIDTVTKEIKAFI